MLVALRLHVRVLAEVITGGLSLCQSRRIQLRCGSNECLLVATFLDHRVVVVTALFEFDLV